MPREGSLVVLTVRALLQLAEGAMYCGGGSWHRQQLYSKHASHLFVFCHDALHLVQMLCSCYCVGGVCGCLCRCVCMWFCVCLCLCVCACMTEGEKLKMYTGLPLMLDETVKTQTGVWPGWKMTLTTDQDSGRGHIIKHLITRLWASRRRSQLALQH